jgi:hypothetical protein
VWKFTVISDPSTYYIVQALSPSQDESNNANVTSNVVRSSNILEARAFCCGKFHKDMSPPLFSTWSHGSVIDFLSSKGEFQMVHRRFSKGMFEVFFFGFSRAKIAGL